MNPEEVCFSIRPDELVRKDVWFAMGYRDAVPERNICELVDAVAEELVPAAAIRYLYRFVKAARTSPTTITLDGIGFRPGGIICSYLDGMTDACVFVATAGREFDEALKRLNRRGDIVADFVADAIGTVLAELAVNRLESRVHSETAGSLSYSPGYCGWDIREQQDFFRLFPPQPCGIMLGESFLMKPEKSISGFCAFGEKLTRQPYHCRICKNVNCYKRKI